jgi:hypothetical protein
MFGGKNTVSLSPSHPNKFNTRKQRGRPMGRKPKTLGVCSGRIQMECNRLPSCKYVYGNKRQYCRKSKFKKKSIYVKFR